ncbi:hypothetical protein ABT354_15230 [Streptomyces sp. NPDC000594]|uniref:hypothetical protein n=1 Tax=Streptomyces sp. NPDC000594 TaxID=3154261 RepID=UPI00332546C9
MSSSSERDRDGRRPDGRRRAPLIASVVAVVLVASGAGTYIAAADRGGGERDRSHDTAAESVGMRQGSTPGPLLSTPLPPTGGVAPGEPAPSGGTVYRAVGELPEGPGHAAPYRPSGRVSADGVTRLARALGMAGVTARSAGPEWVAGGGGDGAQPVLRVAKGSTGSWSYQPFGGMSGSDSCARGEEKCSLPAQPGPGSAPDGAPDGGAPGERAAKEAARPVLKALGQPGAALTATEVVGATRVVRAEPVVGGLPTHGWTTELRIGPGGTVLGGTGHLAPLTRGEGTEVVPAAEALKRLNALSRVIAPSLCGVDLPLPLGTVARTAGKAAGKASRTTAGAALPAAPAKIPCGVCATAVPLDGGPGQETVCTKGKPPAAPRPVPVVSAVFGLSLQYPEGAAALVPAWLFRAEPAAAGALPYTVVQPAAAGWKAPLPSAPDPGGPPSDLPAPDGPGAKGPDEPGAKGPDRPGPEEPGGAGPGQLPSYTADGPKLTVTFWGGVCGTHRLSVREDTDRVAVRMTETPPESGEVCIGLAKEIRKSVTLKRPLGDRTVVDAAGGKALTRS